VVPPLAERRAEAKILMEKKDYGLLFGLQKAAAEGEELPDVAQIDLEVPPWPDSIQLPLADSSNPLVIEASNDKCLLHLRLPLIREVDGHATVIVVRSLSSRAACSNAIYGKRGTQTQPQARDIVLACILLYAISLQPKPMRFVDRCLIIYSDQAFQNTMQYLVELGPTGPIINGFVYKEITPEAVLTRLRLTHMMVATGDGKPDFVFDTADAQMAAAAAELITQKQVGWKPVAGYPCKACGFADRCIPKDCEIEEGAG
jgi:hypothetical protein